MPNVRKGVVFASRTCFQHNYVFVPGNHGIEWWINASSFGASTQDGIQPGEIGLFPTENNKRKARREMVHRRGVATTTLIDVGGDMPPPPKERTTRHNSPRGNPAGGTTANHVSNEINASRAKIEGEGGDDY